MDVVEIRQRRFVIPSYDGFQTFQDVRRYANWKMQTALQRNPTRVIVVRRLRMEDAVNGVAIQRAEQPALGLVAFAQGPESVDALHQAPTLFKIVAGIWLNQIAI